MVFCLNVFGKPNPAQPWKWSNILWKNGFHLLSLCQIALKLLWWFMVVFLVFHQTVAEVCKSAEISALSVTENSPGINLQITLFWDLEIRENPSDVFFFFMTEFLTLTLKLKSSQSGKHPGPGVLSLVWCPACCGNCDTFFALKNRWELATTYIRVPPTHWQTTDSKVAIWNLGPNHHKICCNFFFVVFVSFGNLVHRFFFSKHILLCV